MYPNNPYVPKHTLCTQISLHCEAQKIFHLFNFFEQTLFGESVFQLTQFIPKTVNGSIIPQITQDITANARAVWISAGKPKIIRFNVMYRNEKFKK